MGGLRIINQLLNGRKCPRRGGRKKYHLGFPHKVVLNCPFGLISGMCNLWAPAHYEGSITPARERQSELGGRSFDSKN